MLWTGEGNATCIHGERTKIALDNICVEIEDDVKISKGVVSKDNIIATDVCEYLSVKFIECDVRLNFRKVELMDSNLLVGFEFSGHCNTGDGFGYGRNDV